MVLGVGGTSGTSNNYILDINSANTNIDISNYQNGFYTVALVCNGQIARKNSSKTINQISS